MKCPDCGKDATPVVETDTYQMVFVVYEDDDDRFPDTEVTLFRCPDGHRTWRPKATKA